MITKEVKRFSKSGAHITVPVIYLGKKAFISFEDEEDPYLKETEVKQLVKDVLYEVYPLVKYGAYNNPIKKQLDKPISEVSKAIDDINTQID